MTQLPAVAKNFFYFCKKCDAERYHKVLTHTSSSSAKIQCEVCSSKKTYNLETVKKAAAKRLTKTPAKPRGAAAKKNKHMEEYSSLRAKMGENTAKYNMRDAFKANQALEHPKFGLGFIVEAQSDKIQVVFEDETRSLVHNRQ